MDNPSEVIARLTARLEALEERVFQLEHPEASPDRSPAVHLPPQSEANLPAIQVPSLPSAGSTLTVLGKSILGMAGAYLLRALAEAGSVPRSLVVILAIIYATLWLAAAARVNAARQFNRVAYALTSVLILAPMLWELTLRFKALSPASTAAILAAFALMALALTWKTDGGPVFWIAHTVSVFASLALMVATQDLPPFLCALLLIALGSEFARFRSRFLRASALTAAGLDLATASLLYIYSLDPSARSGYDSMTPLHLMIMASAPLALYLLSTTLRTVVRKQPLSVYEVVQVTLAFFFACYGCIHFGGEHAKPVIGGICIALAVAMYALPYLRENNSSRTVATYTTWATATFVLGAILLLSQPWLACILAIAAIGSTALGVQRNQLVLEFHGAIELVAAAFFSGLFEFDHHLLLSTQDSSPLWSMYVVFVCSLLSYSVTLRDSRDAARAQLPRFVVAAVTAATASAFAAYLLTGLSQKLHPSSAYAGAGPILFLQTLSLCVVALCLAATGTYLKRRELTWLAYTTITLTAAKVLILDIRHETLLVIAATFFLYAAALILIPRLTVRTSRQPTDRPIAS